MSSKQIDYGKLAQERQQTQREITQIESGYLMGLTDAVTFARASGVLDPMGEVRMALLEGRLPGKRVTATRWEISSLDLDAWIDRTLQAQNERMGSMIELGEAKSRAREAGLQKASDRVLSALKDNEIKDAELVGIRWLIPREQFDAWLNFQLADAQLAADGTISLAEATALARTEGLKSPGDYLLLACVLGELKGAYRDGRTWRIPYESYQAWIEPVLAEVFRPEPEQPKSLLERIPMWVIMLGWPLLAWLAWLLVAHSK